MRNIIILLTIFFYQIAIPQSTKITGRLIDCNGKALTNGVKEIICAFVITDENGDIGFDRRIATINSPKIGQYTCIAAYDSNVPVIVSAKYENNTGYFEDSPSLMASSNYDLTIKYDLNLVCNNAQKRFFDAVRKAVDQEAGAILRDNERLGKENDRIKKSIKQLKLAFHDSLAKIVQRIAWEVPAKIQEAANNKKDEFLKLLDAKNHIIDSLMQETNHLSMTADCKCLSLKNKNTIRLAILLKKNHSNLNLKEYEDISISIDCFKDENKVPEHLYDYNKIPFSEKIATDNEWHIVEFQTNKDEFKSRYGYQIYIQNDKGSVINGKGLFLNDIEAQCKNKEFEEEVLAQSELESSLQNTIYFETLTFKIRESSKEKVDDLYFLMTTSSKKIRLIGYTGNMPNKQSAQKLAEDRANLIKKLLIKKGIREDRIEIIGEGYKNPICNGCIYNQRVEYFLVD